jgi:16S rRNA processing protein RimM
MEKVYLGKLSNTHGIKGEVKIHSKLEDSAFYLQKGEVIVLKYGKQFLEFKIIGHRVHKKMDMVRFEGINDINEVEKYKGCNVYFYEQEKREVELEEGQVLVGSLLQCEVVTTEGETLGKVIEVFNTGSSDILRVEGAKDCLIPYIHSVVVGEDFENKIITVELIEGLVE